MAILPDYLNALTAASDAPPTLTYGDVDVDVTDSDTLQDVIAEAKKADEPLYLHCTTADDRVPFLYKVEENAEPDAWRDQFAPPTVALFKAPKLINVWALETPVSRDVAKGLAISMGTNLNDPIPTPGANGWETIRCEPDATVSFASIKALYEPDGAKDEPKKASMVFHNDARVLTPYAPDDPAYAQEIIVTAGAGRDAKKWTPRTMAITAFVDLITEHRESAKKDGPAIVIAEIVGPQRKKVAVKNIYGVGLDIDVGVPGEVIDAAMVKFGRLAVRYTTHSHGKTASTIRKDRLIRYSAKVGGEVDEALVRRFIREEEQWDNAIVETVEYLGDDHEPEGVMAKLSHAPMPKHRIILPFATPFVIAEVGKTQDEGMRIWSEVPKGVARMLGDLPLDKAALDPSRLFYTPRHAKGRQFEVSLVGGPLLDWRDLRVVADDAFTRALDQETRSVGGGGGRSRTAEGKALGRWSTEAATGFQVVDVIRDHAVDRIRTDSGDKIEIECPFDEEHSNAGDPEDRACFAVNAGDGWSDIFTVKCLHASCAEKTNLDHLGKMLKDGWFAPDVLQQEAYSATISEATPPLSPDLLTSFPPPSTGYGEYAYRTFEERPWLYQINGKDSTRLHTPFSIETGVIYADYGKTRALRVKLLDENGAMQSVDLMTGLAVRSGGTELKATLREQGLLMTSEGESQVIRLLKETQPRDPITVYSRPGWHDGVFLTPWGSAVGAKRRVELTPDNKPPGPEKAGSLEGWIDAAAEAFHHNVLHFQVGTLAAFVSPLLDLCGYPSVWIAYTGSTSRGKSTAQKLQAAAWGDPAPKKGMFGNFNGTVAASEALLARASGVGYAFDEAHTIDGGDLQKLVFKATSDGGADRLTRNAELRSARSWTLLVTLSNETSLYQKIKGAGASVTTGLGARALDLSVEDGPDLGPADMKKIEAAFDNHGHAGRAFVHAIIDQGYWDDVDGLRREVEEKASKLAGEKAQPPVRRAARIAALLWQAAVIAQVADLVPEDFDAETMARRVWEKTMEAETAPGSAEANAVRTLFENLIKRRGSDVAEGLGGGGYREATAWRLDSFKTYGPVYIIPTNTLAALAGGALNHNAVTKALSKRGFVILNERKDKTSYVWDSVPGLGAVRAVVIKAAAVEEESEA